MKGTSIVSIGFILLFLLTGFSNYPSHIVDARLCPGDNGSITFNNPSMGINSFGLNASPSGITYRIVYRCLNVATWTFMVNGTEYKSVSLPICNSSDNASFVITNSILYFKVNGITEYAIAVHQTDTHEIYTLTSSINYSTSGFKTSCIVDECPNDPNKTSAGACGCGIADTDSDNDGIPNCNDLCPTVTGNSYRTWYKDADSD